MAVIYDAPSSGHGYPDFETKLALYWTRYQYPQISLGNNTMINFGRTAVIQLGYWNATALDTEDTNISGFYLYEETKPELIRPGGLVEWQQWYGNIPSTYDTVASEAVTFPGYYSQWDADSPVSPATSVYRPPLTKVVNVREKHSFVLSTDPFGTFSPAMAMKIQTAEKAYVDYVDDNTLCNAGAQSPSTATPETLTYSEWQDKINETGGADKEFVCKEPAIQRAYGAGNIWELIEYFADAQ